MDWRLLLNPSSIESAELGLGDAHRSLPLKKPQALSRGDAAAEMGRLLTRLDSFPTREEDDRALLAQAEAGEPGQRSWRTETILRFRIERKRALRHRIRKLRDHVGEL